MTCHVCRTKSAFNLIFLCCCCFFLYSLLFSFSLTLYVWISIWMWSFMVLLFSIHSGGYRDQMLITNAIVHFRMNFMAQDRLRIMRQHNDHRTQNTTTIIFWIPFKNPMLQLFHDMYSEMFTTFYALKSNDVHFCDSNWLKCMINTFQMENLNTMNVMTGSSTYTTNTRINNKV